jgi:3-keto-disaccharide hydrolase
MSSVYPPFGGPPAQRCLRCGTPLPSNVVTCVNCGTYNPVAQPGGSLDQGQSQWGGSTAQTSYSGGQYSGPQWGQAPVPLSQDNQWGQPPVYPQNNPFGTPYMPQAVSSPNNIYGIPGQDQQSNVNNYYGMPQQNAYYSSPSATHEGYSSGSLNGYAPAGYNRPPQKKRGPKVGLLIGIVLLVIVLVGGAFTGYTYYKSHFQNGNVNTIPTNVSTPSVTPLFGDSFTNNTTGWDLTSNPGKFSVKVGGGSMVLEDDDNKLLWEILPGKNFTDFRLDVDATLIKGDPNNGYGVFIRGASSQGSQLGTYYRFELYGDSNYAIFKGSLDTNGQSKSTQVQDFPVNDAIAKAGNVNHITIIAKGPAMTLMVNGQTIFTYTDDNYKSGSIALFVSNIPKLTPGAQATFTNLAIFPVT